MASIGDLQTCFRNHRQTRRKPARHQRGHPRPCTGKTTSGTRTQCLEPPSALNWPDLEPLATFDLATIRRQRAHSYEGAHHLRRSLTKRGQHERHLAIRTPCPRQAPPRHPSPRSRTPAPRRCSATAARRGTRTPTQGGDDASVANGPVGHGTRGPSPNTTPTNKPNRRRSTCADTSAARHATHAPHRAWASLHTRDTQPPADTDTPPGEASGHCCTHGLRRARPRKLHG